MTSGRDVAFMAILGGVFAVALVSLALDLVLPGIQAWETVAALCITAGAGGVSTVLGIRYSLSHLGCFDSEKIGKGKVIVNNAQVTCNDGVILPAFVYRTSETQEERDATTKKPGLLFIHGFSGAPEDGECYTKALAVAGFVCMAYSQRGHGRRRKAPGSRLEWWKMWHDFPVVLDAFLALPDVDPNRVFVMGHSLGSNLAMTRGYNDPRVKAVIALSGMPIQAMESRPGGGSRPRIASMFKRFFNGSGLSLEEGLAMISPMSNAPKDDPRAKNRIFLIRCRDDIFPAEPFNNMKAWFGVPDEHCLFLDHGGHKAEGQHAIITAQLIRWLDRVE